MSATPWFSAGSPRRSWAGWLNLAASLLALFLMVAGARWWLVQTYTTELPYVDQWDGEAAAVLKPWAEGHLQWHDLLVPHNEHRVVLTRALCLGLFAANGQWDGQLETAVNAALCGGFAVLMAAVLLRVFGSGWRWTILAALAVYGTLPFGWENTLNGFQSQNYFLVFFSLAAIWGLGLHRAGAAEWWMGLAGAVLACLSMGSGFLAAAAVLGLMMVQALRGRVWPDWRDGITAVLCVGIVVAGWVTRTVVPAHAFLRADSSAAFLRAFCRYLAWPFYDQPTAAWWMAAPLLVLTVVYLRRVFVRGERMGDQRVKLLLGVGGWCVLQVAALAYTRDGHGAPPACRYMDLLAIFPLTNWLAAALLVREFAGSGRGRVAGVTGVAACWMGVLACGLWQETAKDFRVWLPGYLAAQRQSEANARGYLRTGDFARYLAGKPPDEIAFPRPERLRELLDDPTIGAFLPADVRAPLAMRIEGAEDNVAFVPNGLPPTLAAPPWTEVWGSYPGRQGSVLGSLPENGVGRRLPYLAFQFAGDVGEPGLSFVLRAAASSRRLDWRPSHVPHERWRVDYLRRPGSDLRVEASAARAGKWFAFSEPVEVGGWSYRAGWVLRRARLAFWAGWLLAALAVGESWWRTGGLAPGRASREGAG